MTGRRSYTRTVTAAAKGSENGWGTIRKENRCCRVCGGPMTLEDAAWRRDQIQHVMHYECELGRLRGVVR